MDWFSVTEADAIKEQLNLVLREINRHNGTLAYIENALGEVQGTLLTMAFGSDSSKFAEHISLIEAIKLSIELDMGNMHVLARQLLSHRDSL